MEYTMLYVTSLIIILGWPKSNILRKNPNELFGQPDILEMYITRQFWPYLKY